MTVKTCPCWLGATQDLQTCAGHGSQQHLPCRHCPLPVPAAPRSGKRGGRPSQPPLPGPAKADCSCGLPGIQTLPCSNFSPKTEIAWKSSQACILGKPTTPRYSLLPLSVQSKCSSIICSEETVFSSHNRPYLPSLSPGSGSQCHLHLGGQRTRLPQCTPSAP